MPSAKNTLETDTDLETGSTDVQTMLDQRKEELKQSASELKDDAMSRGRQVASSVRQGSAKVYQVVRARPRLTAGLLVLGGVAITAFLLRKRIPGAAEKLTAAAAGIAIAAGAPEALDRIRDASRKAAKSKLVKRSIEFAQDTPENLGKLTRQVVKSKPVRQAKERMRAALQ